LTPLFGKSAKQFTSELVFGKVVEVETVATDRYGRTVAFVQVENILVNEELIKEGFAWVYRKYCTLPLCNDRWADLNLRPGQESEASGEIQIRSRLGILDGKEENIRLQSSLSKQINTQVRSNFSKTKKLKNVPLFDGKPL